MRNEYVDSPGPCVSPTSADGLLPARSSAAAQPAGSPVLLGGPALAGTRMVSTPRRERQRRPRAWAVAAVGALFLAGGCAGGSGGTRVDPLASALDADLDTYWAVFDRAEQVRTVLVLSDGEPVLERYTGATEQDRFDIHSVTKSVSATLIGIAIDQGRIASVEQTLGDLLPNYAADMSPAVAAITLRQVLTHTAGFPLYWTDGPAFWESEDWVGTILRDLGPRDGADGKFRYSDAGTHLLAAILVQGTGQPVLDYARTHLFDPLGIPTEPAWEAPPDGPATTEREFFDAYNASGDFAWPVDPQGHHTAWSLLKLRPQDLARLGQLYLNKGNGTVTRSSWPPGSRRPRPSRPTPTGCAPPPATRPTPTATCGGCPRSTATPPSSPSDTAAR